MQRKGVSEEVKIDCKGIEECTHEVKLIIEIMYQEYIKDWAVFWNCLECNTTGAIQERKEVKI